MSEKKNIIVTNSSLDPVTRGGDTSNVNFHQMLAMLDKYAVDNDGTVSVRKGHQIIREVNRVDGEMPSAKFKQFLDNLVIVQDKKSAPLPSSDLDFKEKEIDHYTSQGVAVYKFEAYVTMVLALLRGQAAYVGHVFKRYKFDLSQNSGVMKTGGARTLSRYLYNILKGTEFDHSFDKMVVNVSWSVRSCKVLNGIYENTYIKKDAINHGDYCELHDKSDQNKVYVTLRYDDQDSLVLLYLKFFSLFRVKKSDNLSVVPRGRRLFDPDLLFKIICCK